MSNQRNHKGRYARSTGRHLNPAALVFVDLLMVGVILVTFAVFHHVLPMMISRYGNKQTLRDPSGPVYMQPTEGDHTVPDPEATDGGTGPSETLPDTRTEWQKKFADHFTDEIVKTPNSYTSPEVSVTIETVTVGEGSSQTVYHVADIYVASLDNFVTSTPNNEMRAYVTQDVLKMDAAANAILSISGDFMVYQKGGFLMRNGEIYMNNTNVASICVLYEDGTMETYDGKTYDIEEVVARGAVQVWSFGPVLLDADGNVRDSYNVSAAVSYVNPRSAVGYYEPGHYCFVVVDGRQKNYSAGLTIPQLAEVFAELGCKAAYNLDGGGSAVMVFGNERYSRQSNGGDRKLGDILVIRESAAKGENGQ